MTNSAYGDTSKASSFCTPESGDMATGWKDVNGIWYYLYSDGSMAYNTIIDGYNLDVSGAWI